MLNIWHGALPAVFWGYRNPFWIKNEPAVAQNSALYDPELLIFLLPGANISPERTWNVLRKCLYSFPVVQGLICCHSYRVKCLPGPFRTAAPNGMLFSVSYPLEIPKLPALKSIELHRNWFNHHVWTLCRIYITRAVILGVLKPASWKSANNSPK